MSVLSWRSISDICAVEAAVAAADARAALSALCRIVAFAAASWGFGGSELGGSVLLRGGWRGRASAKCKDPGVYDLDLAGKRLLVCLFISRPESSCLGDPLDHLGLVHSEELDVQVQRLECKVA